MIPVDVGPRAGNESQMDSPSTALCAPLLKGVNGVVCLEMDTADAPDLSALHPEEAAKVEKAIDKRQRQFACGRFLARRALHQLGTSLDGPLLNGPLLNGEDRCPLWPSGIIGTITHTRGHCAVAVARQTNLRAIGLDVEQAEPLKAKLVEAVTTERDRAWLGEQAAQGKDALALAKVLFSAKECAYKAQYLLTRQYLGFSAMSVVIDDNRFVATFEQDAGDETTADRFVVGDRLEGQVGYRDGLVATAVVIPPR